MIGSTDSALSLAKAGRALSDIRHRMLCCFNDYLRKPGNLNGTNVNGNIFCHVPVFLRCTVTPNVFRYLVLTLTDV